jgi:hypothetical protein
MVSHPTARQPDDALLLLDDAHVHSVIVIAPDGTPYASRDLRGSG